MNLPTMLFENVLSKFYNGDKSKSGLAWSVTRMLSDNLSIASPMTIEDTVASIVHLEVKKNTVKGWLLLDCLFDADKVPAYFKDIELRLGRVAIENGGVVLEKKASWYPPVFKGFIMDLLNAEGSVWRYGPVTLSIIGSDIVAEGVHQMSTQSTTWEDFYSMHYAAIDALVDKHYTSKNISATCTAYINADTVDTAIESRVETQSVAPTVMDFALLKSMLYFTADVARFSIDEFGTESLYVEDSTVKYSKFLEDVQSVTNSNFDIFYASHKSIVDAFVNSGKYLDDRLTDKFKSIFVDKLLQFPYYWEGEGTGIQVEVVLGEIPEIKVINIRTVTKTVVFIYDTRCDKIWSCSKDYAGLQPVLFSILLQME